MNFGAPKKPDVGVNGSTDANVGVFTNWVTSSPIG